MPFSGVPCAGLSNAEMRDVDDERTWIAWSAIEPAELPTCRNEPAADEFAVSPAYAQRADRRPRPLEDLILRSEAGSSGSLKERTAHGSRTPSILRAATMCVRSRGSPFDVHSASPSKRCRPGPPLQAFPNLTVGVGVAGSTQRPNVPRGLATPGPRIAPGSGPPARQKGLL